MKSKKQFSISKLHEHKFFVDRSLGSKKFASLLKSAGFRIEVHHEHFKADEVDPVWLTVCGERRWVVLTSDKRIETQWSRQIEAAGVCVIIVYTYLDDPVEAWFERIKKVLPRLLRILRKTPPPFVAHITRNGISTLKTAFHHSVEDLHGEDPRRD